MSKKYIMLSPTEEAATEEAAIKEMIYFGENSKNYRFPDIEVNAENQAMLQNLVHEYHDLILLENNKDLDLESFFAGKEIKIEHVEEFEEPRDMFIMLIYFREICKLTDFEPVAAIEV